MDMCHSGGIVQGGFVTGWIDSAMAHAVIASPNYEVSPLSLEIIAEAWIEKRGNRPPSSKVI